MKPSPDTKFSALCSHYEDTFAHLQETLKRRDRLFVWIVLIVALMLFQLVEPHVIGQAIKDMTTNKLGLQKAPSIDLFESFLWFVLLGLLVRYFQRVVHHERLYKYIQKIENKISESYSKKLFTREGKSYSRNSPLFSKWTWILYTWLFPLLLIAITSSKLYVNLVQAKSFTIFLLFNSLAFIVIAISTVLYLLLIHFKK